MAAVYFLLTSEIDKNPFTLFLLRDVDLKQYFNVKNSEIEPTYPLPVTEMKEVTNAKKEPSSHCELVKIPPLANFILDCLSPNPVFSMQLDYKDVMMEFYRYKKLVIILTLQSKNSLFRAGLELANIIVKS
jgi:uncharacterized Zn finger protein